MKSTSDRLYCALLLLYPARFRRRFGPEMAQIFHDQRRIGKPATLWMRAIEDLAVSLLREWRRVIIKPADQVDFTGLADAFMISVVVGTNLLTWGWMGAVVALDLEAPTDAEVWSAGVMAATAVIACALAVLIGILSASIVARLGRPHSNHIKV